MSDKKMRDNMLLKSIFTEKYYQIYDLHNDYILNSIFSILHKLNISDSLRSTFISLDELMQCLHVHDQAEASFKWMFNFLEQAGYLERINENNILLFRSVKELPLSQTDRIAREILDMDMNWRPFIELVDSITSQYHSFLDGSLGSIELLFYKEKLQLWNNYFNNAFSGYAVFNIFGAYGFASWFHPNENSSILEFGGGTGGAAVELFHALNRNNILSKIERYVFSDISPVFLRTGNRVLSDCFPSMNDKIELRVLDLNKPMHEQRITPASIDAVYAVNALHVCIDIVATLKEIYNTLKENGILVISELVRTSDEQSLPQEFIFTLLESYYNVKTDPLLRKNYGFLTPSTWQMLFDMAGFKDIELITNAINDNSYEPDKNNPVFMLIMKGQKS